MRPMPWWSNIPFIILLYFVVFRTAWGMCGLEKKNLKFCLLAALHAPLLIILVWVFIL